MKIAFDATTAAFKQKTGTGVYVDELIRAYQQCFAEDQVTHTYRLSRRLRGREFLVPLAPNAVRATVLDPWTFLSGSKYDIFHGLNSRLPALIGCKMVATIHDVFSIFGEFSQAQFREDQTRKLRQMIKRSDHIIVPASYTADILVNKMHVTRESISCVGLGVRELFLKPNNKNESFKLVSENFKVREPYFLFVGALEKRKNVVGCVRAYARYRALNPNEKTNLVLVGHPGYKYEEIKSEIESCGYQGDIKILGFVGEDFLAHLYRACEALLFLSLEEGFGIPIIEAMACGAPVISSNTTSLPEAGGGFSWLVSPTDFEAAAHALAVVRSSAANVVEKVKGGTQYARAKTWQRVAEETRAVYLKFYSPS